jgi:hypothetical protein
MKILANRIAKELKTAKHCAVYEPELTRVWPTNGKRREAAVALFAEQHGFRVRYYKDGFCAIFDTPPSGPQNISRAKSRRLMHRQA